MSFQLKKIAVSVGLIMALNIKRPENEDMLRPLYDQIIVRQINDPKTTSGGIILAGKREDDNSTGEVVAVGPGRILNGGTLQPIDINAGDKVLYHKFAGHEVNHGGETFRIIREHEVLAVFEGE